MPHVQPTTGRFLARLSAGVLAVGTAALVLGLPGTAAADTPTASTSASPSDSAAATSSSAAPSSSATPSSSAVPSTSSATATSSPAPSTAPSKGVELARSMTGATTASAQGRVAGAATPQLAAGAPAGMPRGVDVSSWQHTPKAATDINWPQVAASGQRFALVKATEGDYYTNPFLTSDLNAAHAAGLVVGAYHFARPSIPAITQADAFATSIRGMPYPHLPPVVDIESLYGPTEDNTGAPAMQAWLAPFLQRVAADTGTTPMIYVNPSYWSTNLGNSTAFGQYPLWEANYTNNAAPTAIPGWSTYSLWQYTSTGSVPGISGSVDQDVFNTATGADLSNLNGPIGMLDSATLATDGTLSVSGWTFDPDTPTTSSGVTVVIDAGAHALIADAPRADIGNAYPSAGSLHGYGASYQVGPGTHNLCVYALDTAFSYLHTTLGCRSLTLVPSLPTGVLEAAALARNGTLTVSGWTFDSDTPGTAVTVQLVVDGTAQSLTANGSRPDVGAAFPAAGSGHGYSATAQLTPGKHTVCVYAVDNYFAYLHSTLGCRQLTYVPSVPLGSWEGTGVAADGGLAVSGWSFDPDN